MLLRKGAGQATGCWSRAWEAVAGAAVAGYLLGAAIMTYAAVCTSPVWLCEHPASMAGRARRTLTVIVLILLWPLVVLDLRYRLSHDRRPRRAMR